jgi:hypothetical protein
VRRAPALLVALLALLATACGVPTDAEPRGLNPAEAPFRIFEAESPAPAGDGRVALYFVREDQVVLQTRAVERYTGPQELLELLLEGPTRVQVEAGIRTALPTTFTVEDVSVGDNGVAVVTLGGDAAEVGTSPLGFAQVVATLTAPGRARAVRFRIDGTDLDVPRGDGSLTSNPLTGDDYANLLGLTTPTPSPAPAEAEASPAS